MALRPGSAQKAVLDTEAGSRHPQAHLLVVLENNKLELYRNAPLGRAWRAQGEYFALRVLTAAWGATALPDRWPFAPEHLQFSAGCLSHSLHMLTACSGPGVGVAG